MKTAIILHAKDNSPAGNWYTWLHQQLQKYSYQVFTPTLPDAHEPDPAKFNHHINSNLPFKVDAHTIIIGHSSGSVGALQYLQSLPSGTKIDTCYLVSSFKDNLNWDELTKLFNPPLDYSNIRSKAKKFVLLHSDNDPYCPLEHAQYISSQLGGELIVQPGQKHFSIGTMGEDYKQFPLVLELTLNQGMTGIIYEFVNHLQLMSVATVNKEPWIANVYYAVDKNLNFYWVSEPDRVHSQHLANNSYCAVSVINSSHTPKQSKKFVRQGLQMSGVGEIVTDKTELDQGLRLWCKALGIKKTDYYTTNNFIEGKIPQKLYRFTPNKLKLFSDNHFTDTTTPTIFIEKYEYTT